MKTKVKRKKEWIDEGFGFPVTLLNVPVVTVRGVETLEINYKKYARLVLVALAHKPVRLTGNELHFIRQHFEKTLKEFAERFGQKSHQAVMKWEDYGNKSTNMNWTTEKDIRLFVLNELKIKPTAFKELYQELEEQKPSSKEPVTISAEQLAA